MPNLTNHGNVFLGLIATYQVFAQRIVVIQLHCYNDYVESVRAFMGHVNSCNFYWMKTLIASVLFPPNVFKWPQKVGRICPVYLLVGNQHNDSTCFDVGVLRFPIRLISND